jgi:hypothetical protein
MDTAAACRTYNILASEGRSVVAALLLEQPTQHMHTHGGPDTLSYIWPVSG